MTGAEIPLAKGPALATPVLLACPLCRAEVEVADMAAAQDLSCNSCHFALLTVVPPPAPPVVEEGPPTPESELERWLNGEPIRKKPLGAFGRVLVWARQRPLTSTAAAALLVALALLSVGSTIGFLNAHRSLQSAMAERNQAVSARQQLIQAANQRLSKAREYYERWQSEEQSRQALDAALRDLRQKYDQSETLRKIAHEQSQRAQREARISLAAQLTMQAQRWLSQSPQRSLLLAAEALRLVQQEREMPIAAAMQAVCDIVSSADCRMLHGHNGKVSVLATSPDGHWLASGGHDGTIRLWDLKSADPVGMSKVCAEHRNAITAIAFTPDGRWLITGCLDSNVCLWSLETAEPRERMVVLRGHKGRISSLAVSRDSRWLVTGSTGSILNENSIRLWDLKATDPGGSGRELPGQQRLMHAVAISPNGHWIVAGNQDGTASLWNLDALTASHAPTLLPGHDGAVRAVHFTADNRWLITAADGVETHEHALRLWDLTNANPASASTVLRGEPEGTRILASTPDSRWLITAGDEKGARVWDLGSVNRSHCVTMLHGHSEAIKAAAVSGDGKWIVTASGEGTICLWTVGTQGPTTTPVVLRTYQGQITSVAISADSHWLATSTEEGSIQLRNLSVDDLVRVAFEGGRPTSGLSPPVQAKTRSNPLR